MPACWVSLSVGRVNWYNWTELWGSVAAVDLTGFSFTTVISDLYNLKIWHICGSICNAQFQVVNLKERNRSGWTRLSDVWKCLTRGVYSVWNGALVREVFEVARAPGGSIQLSVFRQLGDYLLNDYSFQFQCKALIPPYHFSSKYLVGIYYLLPYAIIL